MNFNLVATTAAEELATVGEAAVNGTFFEELWKYVSQLAGDLFKALPVLLVNLVLCVCVWFLAKFIIGRITKYTGRILTCENRHVKKLSPEQQNRQKSVATLVRSVLRYLIYFVAIMIMLGLLGVRDTATLIASAGIGSVAIGFGAQSLVKDVISGLFMVFENQYAVGDYIKLSSTGGDVEGTVEAIAMRVTYLRNTLGQQYIIPNGNITMVTNCTRGDWMAVVEVDVAYEEDTRRACQVMLEAAKDCVKTMPDMVAGDPVIQGVKAFGASGVTLRLVCRSKATQQWEVERRLRLAIKERFDQEGIEIPYNKLVVMHEESAATEKEESK